MKPSRSTGPKISCRIDPTCEWRGLLAKYPIHKNKAHGIGSKRSIRDRMRLKYLTQRVKTSSPNEGRHIGSREELMKMMFNKRAKEVIENKNYSTS